MFRNCDGDDIEEKKSRCENDVGTRWWTGRSEYDGGNTRCRDWVALKDVFVVGIGLSHPEGNKEKRDAELLSQTPVGEARQARWR